MREWRCIGCGGPLQNTDKDAPFYTPKPYEDDVPMYCERCYKIRHYGQIKPSFVSESVILETLKSIEERPGIMVLIVDGLDFFGSMHPFFNELSVLKRTLLIVNKMDVIPKSVNRAHLKANYAAYAKKSGLHVEEILLVSAAKKSAIDEMVETIRLLSNGQDVFLMGVSNVGKSSLLNALLASFDGINNRVTTSFEANITQGLIPFKLKSYTLYDTPGFAFKGSYRYYLSGESLRKVMPLKEIKQRVYQQLSHRVFYLAGLFYIAFDASSDATMITYFAPTLTIHHRKTGDEMAFYLDKIGDFLNPPALTDPKVPVVKTTVHHDGTPIDLHVPGLGFMTLRHVETFQMAHYASVKPVLTEVLI